MDFFNPVPLQHSGPSDVTLVRIDIPFALSLEGDLFLALSADEQARARKFRRHEDAMRFAVMRAGLRHLLATRLGVEPTAVQLTVDSRGRPRLCASDPLDFNLSHSGAHGLIALSSLRRVGVDIEQCIVGLDWRAIAPLALDVAEIELLLQLDVTEAVLTFYDGWVAKEALLKAAGVGIVRELNGLVVLPRIGRLVTFRKAPPANAQTLRAAWVQGPPGYAACVAWGDTL